MPVHGTARQRVGSLLATVLIAVTLILAGCSGDDPATPPTPEAYPWPESADALMSNFERAYSEMSIDEYRLALHEDFKFIFIESVYIWDRDDDLQSTQNMFAGNDGQNPDGSLRDGVQSIAVNTLIRQTHWLEIPGNDPDFPNTLRALYQVSIVFTLNGGENTITIHCDQEFFIKAEDVEEKDGTLRTRYFLIGQRDMASGAWSKTNADMHWGSVKSLYY